MKEIYLDWSANAREAGIRMGLFLEQLRKQGVDYRVKGNQRIVITEGKEFHFVTDVQYDTWIQGRTYYYKGRKFRSGNPVE